MILPFKKASLIFIKDKPAIKITFPFNRTTQEQIKSLYRSSNKSGYWRCPFCYDSMESLQQWGFRLDPDLKLYLKSIKIDPSQLKPLEVPGFKKSLYRFQKIGVAFIEARKGRVLLADEMGLGKTIQALAWLQLHPNRRPAIVVTPASLKLNWKKEARECMDHPGVQILSGRRTDEFLDGKIMIINYDILQYWIDELLKTDPKILITDECHYYKNDKAKRTKAVKELAREIPRHIALSGTPVINRPIEAYNAIRMIEPRLFPSRTKFGDRFCKRTFDPRFGTYDYSGAENMDQLHKILVDTIMLRRLKKDELKELPAKTRAFVPMPINNAAELEDAEENFLDWISRNQGEEKAKRAARAASLTKIETLKQLTIKGKMKSILEWIDNVLETDQKLVAFCTHKSTIRALTAEFPKICVKMDGDDSLAARQRSVDLFQHDRKIRLFIGMLDPQGKPAGVGHTLTAASIAAFLELIWSKQILFQAEDRLHRITQRYPVNIYYLLAAGTIEEKIINLLIKKGKPVDEFLDGSESNDISIISALMKSYRKNSALKQFAR